MQNNFQRGFGLIELLITLVIVSIITALAYPSYRDSVLKSRRTDGKASILEIAALQEKYYFQHAQYTLDRTKLGGCVNQGDCSLSTEGYYDIVIKNDACGDFSCFEIIATPSADKGQDDDKTCASYSINQVGLKSASDVDLNDTRSTCW